MRTILILSLVILNIAHLGFCDSLLDDFSITSSKDYERIKVVRVISADSVELKNGKKIKLIGLKAPAAPKIEKADTNKHGFIIDETSPLIPMNERAFSFATRLLQDKFVRIEFDVKKKDDNFLTLAYVFLVDDNTFVNAEILRQGYAHLRIQLPNTKYADILREAYKEAKREQRGLQGE